MLPSLRIHAPKARDYGQTRGLVRLTTRKLTCDEAEAWRFTAIACKLGAAQGAYRGPAGKTLVFVTYSDVTTTTKPPTS